MNVQEEWEAGGLRAMKEVIDRCGHCDGRGVVLKNPGRAIGVCWATPHGFPDDTEVACEACSGRGWVYRTNNFHPMDEYESAEEFLAAWEWHEKAGGYVLSEDRKAIEDLW
jgi:hypothetical protein